MANILAALLAALQLLLAPLAQPVVTQRLRSGEWLRFHVVAQDDTAPMQRLKLQVRDAVHSAYSAAASQGPMLAQAGALLPVLEQSAEAAARKAGFTGPVDVQLGVFPFDERELAHVSVPAGEYPALMIRLGDAQGQNWWGLLDPELSLRLASVPEAEEAEPIVWDWSWRALLAALFGLPLDPEGA